VSSLYERALARIPGGVDSPVRSFASVGGEPFFTERGEGAVGVVVYPWEVSVGRIHQQDSAMNLIQGEIRSVVAVGNRVRVRVGPITAEVTASSADKLELARGGTAFATFKATGTRLVPLGVDPRSRDG